MAPDADEEEAGEEEPAAEFDPCNFYTDDVWHEHLPPVVCPACQAEDQYKASGDYAVEFYCAGCDAWQLLARRRWNVGNDETCESCREDVPLTLESTRVRNETLTCTQCGHSWSAEDYWREYWS